MLLPLVTTCYQWYQCVVLISCPELSVSREICVDVCHHVVRWLLRVLVVVVVVAVRQSLESS